MTGVITLREFLLGAKPYIVIQIDGLTDDQEGIKTTVDMGGGMAGLDVPALLGWAADSMRPAIELTYDQVGETLTRYENGQKVGALWGPAVGGYWFAYRDDIAAGTLRFELREDAEKFLRAEVNRD